MLIEPSLATLREHPIFANITHRLEASMLEQQSLPMQKLDITSLRWQALFV
ncbi:hypothetical protein NDI37_11855 [Funiculus sociatus GB2-A5]|uniref:Uncharacterized protein n=1 Tax=Funiculus sociatus GB2-A5 TaxID=2933946 RepID=A0ABV0JPI9_9CYAN